MGQPTMSTQSPQTGGKSGQYGQPGQPSGKGMAGGLMNAAEQQMPQQMSQQMPQMPDQADGNNQVGAPLQPMSMQQTLPQQNNQTNASSSSGMGQGNVTYPSQSGQPVMGMPNAYSNTIGKPSAGMEDGFVYKGANGKGAAASNGKSGA